MTSNGGYAESEMRKYLVKVDGKGGNFLEGLNNAGMPREVLWAPTRRVANGGNNATGTDEKNDLLWLPTEREMFGDLGLPSYHYSNPQETAENQARLEYYPANDNIYRVKYTGNGTASHYWEGSPYCGGSQLFCCVISNGVPSGGNNANNVEGVAPAFCVR
jgi:hypothetical protein